MAYDPNASYEAPRRAYYGQSQQQAPAQHGYDYHSQEQYGAHGGYGEQYGTQGYDYSYDQQPYDQGNGYGSHNGYEQDTRGAYDDYSRGGGGYHEQQSHYNDRPQDQSRQYDARYQPRQDRGHHPDDERQSRRAKQQPAQGSSSNSRPDPRSGRQHPHESRAQPQSHRSERQHPRAANTSNGPTSNGRSDRSMEAWKARERERLHADAASPQTKQWDNAFPVFPSTQQKRDKSRPATADRSADGMDSTQQRSPEHSRPTTSAGQKTNRPGTSREDSYQSGYGGNTDTRRDHHDSYQSQGRSGGQQAMSPPAQQQAHGNRPPPNDPSRYSGATDGYGGDQWEHTESPRQHKPRGPPIAPIDTRQPHSPTQPAYTNHQAFSSNPAPPKSSAVYDAAAGQYGGYGAGPYDPKSAPPTGPPQTRADEIEAEMPDFDSAAPSQTSMLHKVQNKAPTPVQGYGMPPRSINASAQSLPSNDQRYVAQAHDVSSMSLPVQQSYEQQGYGDDFGGGYSGDHGSYNMAADQRHQPEYQQGNPPFQPPFANEHATRRSMDDARQLPYRQAPPGQQRFGPNGPIPRGPSAPPMQMRNPGASQRPGTGQGRGGSDPSMRPGMQRPPNGAPGGRSDMQPPPNSAPPTQQRFGPGENTGTNPDSLPHHPTPVRPGLMGHGSAPPAKPPPVRNYDNASSSTKPSQPRPTSSGQAATPVTMAELNKLRGAVDANPNNNKRQMELVRKLVEASTVLASEGGRADPRTTAKNREKYIMEAHKRLKRMVAALYPEAQFYLADCYGSGSLGLEADDKEAFNLYQAAAKAGHPQAAFRTAVCCEIGPEDGGGTRRDYAKAVQWYRRAAALSDTAGMFKLGIILLRGLLGQQRNIGEAMNWLKRAADRADGENPHALYELAALYEPSNTDREVRNKVLPDEAHARDLFIQAAKLGHRGSQFRLGQAYEYGTLGLEIDNRASIGWYTKAAALGDHQAELALSGWYLTGAEGILEHSDTEAYLWARKAASSEPPLAKAMYAMGYFTETGIGCPANLEEAKRWYGRAASYKFPKAQERLEELRRNPKSGGAGRPPNPANGRLTRKDQKRDEAECTVM